MPKAAFKTVVPGWYQHNDDYSMTTAVIITTTSFATNVVRNRATAAFVINLEQS